MSSFKKYATADKFEAGAKYKLIVPETGEEGDDWVRVRSRHSKAFQTGLSKFQSERAKMGDEITPEQATDLSLRMMAECGIMEWSFEEKLTPALALEFLRSAPEQAARIEVLHKNDSLFLKLASESSKTSQSTTSS